MSRTLLKVQAKHLKPKQTQSAQAGQGVVEYAGAIVVSVSLVAVALTFYPDPFAAFFFQMMQDVMNMFISHIVT